jgi:hypothetical protein
LDADRDERRAVASKGFGPEVCISRPENGKCWLLLSLLPFCSPTKQLALVLKHDSTAFSDLDQLYTQILSVYPSSVNIVRVLGIISVSHGDLAEVMEDIFGMEEGELKGILRGLSSLMNDEIDENGERLNNDFIPYRIPHFAHASFSDYLFNSRRSGRFHVNQQEYEDQVTIRSFGLIIKVNRSG